LRNKKELSLNLEQREADKKRYEQQLLELENTRRTAKELPVFSSYSDWRDDDKASRKDSEEDSTPLPDTDPILFEAGHVFIDYLQLSQSSAPKLVKE